MEETAHTVARWLLTPTTLVLSGIIAGLVECAQRASFPRNLCSALAVGLGVLGGGLYTVFYADPSDFWSPAVGTLLVEGLVVGLMASGVWGTGEEVARMLLGRERPDGTPTQERRKGTRRDVQPPQPPGTPTK